MSDLEYERHVPRLILERELACQMAGKNVKAWPSKKTHLKARRMLQAMADQGYSIDLGNKSVIKPGEKFPAAPVSWPLD